MASLDFRGLDVTHILISCPRGFANERHCWAIPADCLDDAERYVEANNPGDDVRLSRLLTLAAADPSDRSAAGRSLWGSADDYKIGLYLDGPLSGMIDY